MAKKWCPADPNHPFPLSRIACYRYSQQRKTNTFLPLIQKSKPVAILSSIVALAIIFIKYVSLALEQKSVVAKAGSKVIDYTIQVGAIGTVIGFILPITGLFFLKTSVRHE